MLPRNPLHGLPCPDCGHLFNSHAPQPCNCPVIRLSDVPFADVKALFAEAGLSVVRREG